MKLKCDMLRAFIYINILLYLFLFVIFGLNLPMSNKLVLWVIFNVYDVVAYWIVGIMAFAVAMLSNPPIKHRKAWEIIGTGLLLYGLGDLWWDIVTLLYVSSEMLNSVQDVIYILASAFWTYGIMQLFLGIFEKKIVQQIPSKYSLISGFVTMLLFLGATMAVYEANSQFISELIVNEIYVLLDFVFFYLSLKGMLWAAYLGIKPLKRMWSYMFAAALMLAILDTLFAVMTDFFSTYAMVLAYLWIFPMFMIGLASAEYINYLKFAPSEIFLSK